MFSAITQYFDGPKWKLPMLAFVEENCLVFDDDEQAEHEYAKIYGVSSLLFYPV